MKIFIYTKDCECTARDTRVSLSEESNTIRDGEVLYSTFESPSLQLLIDKVRSVTRMDFDENGNQFPRVSAQIVNCELFSFLTGDADSERRMLIPFRYRRTLDCENPQLGYTEMVVGRCQQGILT